MITVKTKEEIAILREGGRRHAAILRELAAMVAPGVHIIDLDRHAAKLIAAGGDRSSFLNYKPYGARRPYPATLCVSVTDEVVHGIQTEGDKVLKEGDVVTLDLGLVHKGMYTDAAITVPVGAVSTEVQSLIETTRVALAAGIKAARGGKHTGDIGNAIERVCLGQGYGLVEELCGHGVGYDVHEDPYVPNYGDPGRGDLLVPGLVISIEPIFTLGGKKIQLDADGYTYHTADGSIAAHEEHTVLITKGGAEILTAYATMAE